MTLNSVFLQWLLGIAGTGILTGLGFILRTLINQNKVLAVLVERVGTGSVSSLESRVAGLEADMSRVWGIYDAWKSGVSLPTQSDHH